MGKRDEKGRFSKGQKLSEYPTLMVWPKHRHTPEGSRRPSYNQDAYNRYIAGKCDQYGKEISK